MKLGTFFNRFYTIKGFTFSRYVIGYLCNYKSYGGVYIYFGRFVIWPYFHNPNDIEPQFKLR